MRSPTRSSSWPSAAAVAAALCLAGAAFAAQRTGSYAPYPDPDSGYVSDHGGVLSDDEEERLERWLWQVETRTGVEIIVVTVRSIHDYPGAPTGSIDEFARGLFNRYGVGNLAKNDGVLLVVAVDDRKARIELGAGYGHARDADAEAIMNQVIVPAFQQGDYPGGITAGVRALALGFAGVRFGFPWHLVALFGGAIALGVIGVSLILNGKRGWGWVFVGLSIVVLLTAIYVLFVILRTLPRGSSRGWSAGGSGGFGGGFSGGGGATGSW